MKTKLLGILSITLGLFLCAGVAAAADADILQPASTITYNENLDVNGTIYTDSISIGEEGVGGVTYFNGSIVNVGADVAVTIADDLRIDGEIYRTEKGGSHPLKISDHIIPTLTEANNFGTEDNRWNNLYAVNGNFSGDVTIQGGTPWTNTNDGAGSGLDADKLDGKSSSYFAKSTHNHDGEYLKLTGGTLTGDLKQSKDKFGAIKALIEVNSNGTIANQEGSYNLPLFTVSHGSNGMYYIDFKFDVSNRFFSLTQSGAATNIGAISSGTHNNEIKVTYRVPTTSTAINTSFFLTVY